MQPEQVGRNSGLLLEEALRKAEHATSVSIHIDVHFRFLSGVGVLTIGYVKSVTHVTEVTD